MQQKDKSQIKLDKRAQALKANMQRRKERLKDLKGQQSHDKNSPDSDRANSEQNASETGNLRDDG